MNDPVPVAPPKADPAELSDFEAYSKAPEPGLLAEFGDFLKHNKKWWLLPILIVLGGFGVIVALLSAGGAATPFIYTLF